MDSSTEETILYTRKSASKVDMKEPESFDPTNKVDITSEESSDSFDPTNKVDITSEESESFDPTNKVDITSEDSSSFLGVNIHDWQPLNNTEVLSIFFFLFLKFQTCEPNNFPFIQGFKLMIQLIFENIKESEISGGSFMLVGSLADDIFICGKSDFDIMLVDKTKLCVTDEKLIINKSDVEGVKIYLGECLNASPGYTLVHKTVMINKQDSENQVIVRPSGDWLYDLSEVNIQIHDSVLKKGPAFSIDFSQMLKLSGLNVFMSSTKWSNDCAAAIPYRNQSIINKWKKRKRVNAWPSKEIQQEISEMPGYIVQVGKKGSRYEQFEWRICYTTAEIKLVKSLNKVQRMLYYKLKEFANSVLKPTYPDVTSYVLKNIIFWIAESVQNKYFTSRNFIPLFRSTLFVLKRCVEKHELPNYMIPERNLFDGKLTDGKTELIKVLSHWIKNCPIIEGENQKALLQCYKQIKCSPRKFIQDFEHTPRFLETHFFPKASQFVRSILKVKTRTDYEKMFVDPCVLVYVNALCMLLSREPKNWMNVCLRSFNNCGKKQIKI